MAISMIFIAFYSLLFVSSVASEEMLAIRATLVRQNESVDYVRDAALSFQRLSMFESIISNTTMKSAKTPLKAAPGDYLMQISIGTPALTFWAIADTGSDLIWTQCIPCTKCFAQPSPYFDPSKTSSFQKLPCSSNLCEALPQGDHTSCTASECGYYYSYVDTAYTKGYLATDTVGLGTVSIPKVGFGCGTYNVGNFGKSAGLVGLARGKLSLVTQIGAQKFSYCLASDQTKPSPLLFGSIATLTGSGVQNTPLITNRFYPTYYYLNLLGIFVGPTHVPILSGTLNPENGDGGLIIDSGTTFTFLERAGYSLVAQAFISQMKNYPAISGSKYGLDLCFQYPKGTTIIRVPKLIFQFQGANMELTAANYIATIDPSNNVFCLLLMPSSGFSILGNVMQMNMHILYDLEGSKLSFKQADCTKV